MKFASNKDIRFLCFIDFRVIFIHAALGVYIFSKRYPFDFFSFSFFLFFFFFYLRQIITRLYCGLKSKKFYQYKRVKKKKKKEKQIKIYCVYISCTFSFQEQKVSRIFHLRQIHLFLSINFHISLKYFLLLNEIICILLYITWLLELRNESF